VTTPTPPLDIQELRRRWKPNKERLAGSDREATSIRFHRACSWLARVEATADQQDQDFGLIGLWIAFNALYGQWDACKREPRPDREGWRAFLDRILRLDVDGRVSATLREHKRLVMSLFEDEYLSSFFWEDPSAMRAGQSRRSAHRAATWYLENRWKLILDELLDRIYLMRCQLIHGAATYGGKLNRTSVRWCTLMLRHLLLAILTVWIDRGAEEDWGPMCYPPLSPAGQHPRTPSKAEPAPRGDGRPQPPGAANAPHGINGQRIGNARMPNRPR